MRRLLPLALALLSLSACRTGGRRGEPTPTADTGAVVTADDGGSIGALRTDRLALVPNLVGLNERDAAAFAQRAGFDVVPLVVAGQPAGVVLAQDRVAGREVPAGTPIGIRVASGRGVASSPSSRTSAPFVPATPPSFTPPTAADMTTPRPEGAAVAAEDAPFVTPTDRGVVVPPVLDRTPEQARRILADAGMRCREEVASGGIPGRVMDQDPPAGARRPAGTEIVVRIPAPPAPPPPTPPDATPAAAGGETPTAAAAPVRVVIPSVLDKTEAVARRILEDLGLRVRGESTTSGVAGRVMDQLPAPGTTVDAGSSIVIRIPGLAVADPVEPAKLDDSAPIPETEFGSPDAAPSTAAAPPAPTSDLPPAPATPKPDAPSAPTIVPALPPVTAPPPVEPPSAAPPVAGVDDLPPPPPPPVAAEPPTAPPIAAAEPPAEPVAPDSEPDADEPIFASPRRGPVRAPRPTDDVVPPAVDDDSLPPPPPPPPSESAPAPPPAPEPPPIAFVEPSVSPPEVSAGPPPPLAPPATPSTDAGSEIPPPPPSPLSPPAAAEPSAPPADPSALPVPTLRSPLDGAFFKLAPRVVVEVNWNAVVGATGYLLEVEEVAEGAWVAVERRVVKGTRAVVDLETLGGKPADFRWRVRTVVGRRGGRPAAWAVFHAK